MTVVMVFGLVALVACEGNDNTQDPSTGVDDEEIPVISYEELTIQIDAATDELLSTFSRLHHANLSTPEHEEGVTLVIWANQPLHNFSVTALSSEWLEDDEAWGFMPTFGFGSVATLLPGEAFVVENYMGLGTLPHRGISFTDSNDGNTRVFSFSENHAYPYAGDGLWVIWEIESDMLIWGFSYDVPFPSEIVINGVIFDADMYGSVDMVYSIAGQLPTHVTMSVLNALGLDIIQGGSQIMLEQNNEVFAGLSVVNYLTFGDDRVAVGIDDTFMADHSYFTQYIPISLLKDLGFDVQFDGERVYIDGQLAVHSPTNDGGAE